MIIDPEFLSIDDVLQIHATVLENWGGSEGIRDEGALLSAIAQPEASFGGEFLHDDLFLMAAAYAFHIAENQPFLDGNKRTGLSCAITFLDLNGELCPDPTERLHDAMLAISARTLDKQGLATLLRALAVPASTSLPASSSRSPR